MLSYTGTTNLRVELFARCHVTHGLKDTSWLEKAAFALPRCLASCAAAACNARGSACCRNNSLVFSPFFSNCTGDVQRTRTSTPFSKETPLIFLLSSLLVARVRRQLSRAHGGLVQPRTHPQAIQSLDGRWSSASEKGMYRCSLLAPPSCVLGWRRLRDVSVAAGAIRLPESRPRVRKLLTFVSRSRCARVPKSAHLGAKGGLP